MRLLFVSGTTRGGSGRSQRELASVLRARGHDVRLLVDDDRRSPGSRWWYDQLADASVRWAHGPGASTLASARDSLGRSTRTVEIDGLPHEGTPLPQNALGRLLDEDRPDVVVANSLERWAWRRVHDVCRQRQVPTVLYVREDDSLGHVDSGAVPDALVANARSLADAMAAHGVRCAFVPSVVDTSRTRTTSTREAALAINPLPSRGGDLVWAIAQAAPEIPVVAQESWPLDGDELASVQQAVAGLPNVQLRRAAPPGPGLYGDARVLLVPYRVANRPRVIPEAQSNGIPVIAGDVPALTEAIGDGGLTVPLDSPEAWVDTLRGLWSDAAAYERLSAAALANSRRPEFDPDAVTDAFEVVLQDALTGAGQ